MVEDLTGLKHRHIKLGYSSCENRALLKTARYTWAYHIPSNAAFEISLFLQELVRPVEMSSIIVA